MNHDFCSVRCSRHQARSDRRRLRVAKKEAEPMSVRHVLLVTYHFPPSAASGTYRALGFVRHLPKFGWEASVVAPPSIPWEPTDLALLKSVSASTKVHAVPYPEGTLWKPLRWLDGFAAWLPRAAAVCARVVRNERPAAVLTSGPPHCVHLLGLFLKRRYGLPWAADFRDPWVGNETLVRSRSAAALGERVVMRRADLIIANAPRAAEKIAAAQPRHRHKIVTITNGFDQVTPLAARARQSGDGVRVLHAGDMYTGRDPRPFLDALTSLGARAVNGSQQLQACFIGRNAPKAVAGFDLFEEINGRDLAGAVETRGQVPYSQALAEMQRADILLLLDTPGRTAGVPAKLYEYLGSGQPVLALAEADGDVAAVLRASGVLHRVAAPRNTAAIRQALAELGAAVRAGKPAVTDPDALRRFTRESLTGELARHLDRITRARPIASSGAATDRKVLAA